MCPMKFFRKHFAPGAGFALLSLFLIGCASAPATSPLPSEPAPELSGEPCSSRAIVRVAPRYPREALRNNQGGWVIAAVEYSSEGTIRSAEAVKASPAGIFEQATEDALSKWKLKTDGSGGQCMQLMNYELRR